MTDRLVDPTFWKGKRVLLTGHTGFKGGWAAVWLNRMGAEVTGVSLPPEGNHSLFDTVVKPLPITSHILDIERCGPGNCSSYGGTGAGAPFLQGTGRNL
jgi:CDP-glucose 4,6-dehydratase